MKKIRKRPTNCGPAIACGAASVSWDHKPGDPTSIDRLVSAIVRLFKSPKAPAVKRGASKQETIARKQMSTNRPSA